MIRIPQDEVRDNFDRTVDQVAKNGEGVIIQRNGKDIAALVPAQDMLALEPKQGSDEEPIWRQVVKLGARIPLEEWDEIPPDLSINLDHYLYGSPKVKE